MSLPKNEAWFPAKRYGYGWALPRRWQGWIVMAIYVVALASGATFAEHHPRYFAGYAVVISAGLVLICRWKGEPPRWRWGED